MGTIVRNAFEPFTDGETATDTSAALESDMATLYTEFNGVIANVNVDTAANISGSKIADNTITDGKISASTITTASMAMSAVPKHYVDIVTSGTFVTGQTSTLIDWVGLTAAVLTPGSDKDMIFMEQIGRAHV